MLALPVAVPHHLQEPVADPGSHAHTRQLRAVLAGLPCVVTIEEEPPPPTPASSSLLACLARSSPDRGLCVPQLLGAAAQWLSTSAADVASHEWQLGEHLLQLAGAVTAAAAQEQQPPAGNAQQVQASCQLVVSALIAAAASSVPAAVTAAAEAVLQLLQVGVRLGWLTPASGQQLRAGLVSIALGSSGGGSSGGGSSGGGSSGGGSSSSSAGPASELLGSACVLLPAAAAAALEASGIQQLQSEQLRLLAALLSHDSDCMPWSEAAQLLGGTAVGDALVLLVLLLQAHTSTQAAMLAQRQQSAKVQSPSKRKVDKEQCDYFQDIFGSDDGCDGSKAADAAAAAAATRALEQRCAMQELLLLQLRGLVRELDSLAQHQQQQRDQHSSSTAWSEHSKLLLHAAVCFLGMDVAAAEGSSEQPALKQVAAQQMAVGAAVQRLCLGCSPAAAQLQQDVLLASVSPADAGHHRPGAVLQLVVEAMLQQAAAGVVDAGMLQAPWLHLANGLASAVSTACKGSADHSSSAQQQRSLVWLLAPARVAVLLTLALAAPAAEHVTLAAAMLHCLEQCMAAMRSPAAPGGVHPAAAEGASEADWGLLAGPALALCAVHACLSLLLWLLLLPAAATPTAWLQQQLQAVLQPSAATSGDNSSSDSSPPQLGSVSLPWMTAQLQHSGSTDELPMLLHSLGVSAKQQQEQLNTVRQLLVGLMPCCLPLGSLSGEGMAAVQQLVQQLQQQDVQAEALRLLRSSASDSAAQRPAPSAPAAEGDALLGVLGNAADQVLPAAAAAWAADGASSSCWGVAAAAAFSSCQQRALQLQLLLGQQPQGSDASAAGATSGAAGSFNSFGCHKHLVQLQQQLGAACEREQLLPFELSLHACKLFGQGVALEHGGEDEPSADAEGQQPQHPAAAAAHAEPLSLGAAGVQLAGLLSGALDEAQQRLQLAGDTTRPSAVLKQQLHTCCAEVELLAMTLQVSSRVRSGAGRITTDAAAAR
jgi:hypothetical protein